MKKRFKLFLEEKGIKELYIRNVKNSILRGENFYASAKPRYFVLKAFPWAVSEAPVEYKDCPLEFWNKIDYEWTKIVKSKTVK